MNACKIRAVLIGTASAALLFGPAAHAKPPAEGEAPAKGRTSGYWATVDRVVDGDTVYVNGVKVRIVDIDTPETHASPQHGYKCEAERRLGEIATAEAEALMLGGKVWVKPSGTWDRYDRPLVRLRYARGKWYGEHMIRARLAAPWRGRKHKWCEELTY